MPFQEGREPSGSRWLALLRYNSVRLHKTLRVTPAMAPRIEDRLWSIEELAERTLKKGAIMAIRSIDPEAQARDEDWEGNNAAFTCPVCGKVFIVSSHMHDGKRKCPSCGKSTGHVVGGKKSEGTAKIEWPTSN
jgi:Zn finger protein HypA/HybF involved in hydrogenase expression